MTALTLPRLHWGSPSAARSVLMFHGLGSSAQTCWQVMDALAADGWSATAIDLRGHGSAPRAGTYAIADFAEDLLGTRPHGAAAWDLVIGHSIGAASAVVASAQSPSWTDALVLLDPALQVDDATRQQVLENQRLGHLHQSVDDVAELNPLWHPLDWELKVQANRAASLYALERAVLDNDPWDVTEQAQALVVPTHVLSAPKELGGMFYGDYAENLVAASDYITWEVIDGAGHSLHRDKPQATIQALRAFINAYT
jgi:pimeloyl-ACP methyl ester carboxylesterase